ncbi:MAG: glycoside hydrolase family 3 N-terminal domain-containing protein [Ardenticatenaceae bacterium]|nr:glycoside hydrolase family 3 N-terminal domain-containing protein [Ardenticatenaceae bacterium]
MKPKNAKYQDPTLSVEERVADLLARMTLAEKLAQLGSAWVFELLTDYELDLDKAEAKLALGLGQVTRVAGASNVTPAAGAALANRIQKYLVENTRLGIPAIVHEECCAGYMARDATCFPQIIGVASTWEPELAQKMAAVVRTQMRAGGAHQGLSPVIDIARDPRWGRVEETFGEDPYLVSCMGVAFVRGLQSDDWRQGVIATAKHFVGYGLSEGGMNWAPVHLPERALREVYLLPFEAAVKEANLQSLMNAYHELDGVPCAASPWLLTDLLREQWGFEGTVVSDYFAINEIEKSHLISSGPEQSAVLALEAGIDVELPHTSCYGRPLKEALNRGTVDEALIDRSVGRHLRHKFELGLFENPYVDEETVAAVFDTPEQRNLAREIAQKSIVLLKNEDELLPLSKEIGSMAIIGPNADTKRHLVGDYAYVCHIETLLEQQADGANAFNVPLPQELTLEAAYVPMKTVAEAVAERLSPHTTVHFAQGCGVNDSDRSGFAEAVAAAEKADVALVVVGGRSGLTDECTCGEARDRAEIGLPGVQLELVQALYETGTPIVLLLINGRPLSITWEAEHLPAIIEGWLPGEEGAEAIADVLFGDVNPSGRLPITFPRHVGQIPIYASHKPSGGKSHWKGDYVNLSSKPLWPLGFGLSYTTFEFSDLRLDRSSAAAGESVQVNVDVTNTGRRAGEEVVQLYIRDELASVTRPVKELKGFARVALEPGESKTVVFSLPVNLLAFYDRDMRFVVEPGRVQVMIGSSAEHLPLSAHFEVSGERTEIHDKVFHCPVRIMT